MPHTKESTSGDTLTPAESDARDYLKSIVTRVQDELVVGVSPSPYTVPVY